MNQLTVFSKKSRIYEPYWVNRLSTLEPIQIPYIETERLSGENVCYERLHLSIPDALDTQYQNNITDPLTIDFILGVFFIYLSRLSGTYSYDIGFRDPTLTKDIDHSWLDKLFSSYVPLKIEIAGNQKVRESIACINIQAKITRGAKTFAMDSLLRYPEIKGQFVTNLDLPVVVEVLIIMTSIWILTNQLFLLT